MAHEFSKRFGFLMVCSVFGLFQAQAGDLGYRYDAAAKRCLNPQTRAAGLNPNIIGPCGDLQKYNFKEELEYFAPEARKHPDLLMGRDLRGASLQGVDLRGFTFVGTNLSVADLRNTDLRGAILGEAQLDGTLLTGCKFSESTRLPAGWTRQSAEKRGLVFSPDDVASSAGVPQAGASAGVSERKSSGKSEAPSAGASSSDLPGSSAEGK